MHFYCTGTARNELFRRDIIISHSKAVSLKPLGEEGLSMLTHSANAGAKMVRFKLVLCIHIPLMDQIGAFSYFCSTHSAKVGAKKIFQN